MGCVDPLGASTLYFANVSQIVNKLREKVSL